ncbi:MAG: hypothetical protein E7256_09725 [Lachnospiraceae bacterium]|nr:hypothetical protein [Lachnospiraceae bacterium]
MSINTKRKLSLSLKRSILANLTINPAQDSVLKRPLVQNLITLAQNHIVERLCPVQKELSVLVRNPAPEGLIVLTTPVVVVLIPDNKATGSFAYAV